jgi:hypothetical protein
MNTARTHSSVALAFRDATYACAVQGPRPGRIRNALCWLVGIGLLAASVSAPYWI